MALEMLETLRERHPSQLTAAAYGVLIGACAARGRGAEGVDLFGVFRLDAACTTEAAMQPTPFLYWYGTQLIVPDACVEVDQGELKAQGGPAKHVGSGTSIPSQQWW